MNITGSMLVGGSEVRGTEGVLRAWNPTTGTEMEPDFAAGGQVEVNRACLLAQEAFDSYRETPLEHEHNSSEPLARESSI